MEQSTLDYALLRNEVYVEFEDKIFFIPEGQTTVGRGENNSIVINRKSISEQHVRFNREQTKVWITDLDSHNSVFVNGKQLIANEAYPLKTEDIISIGDEVHFIIKGKLWSLMRDGARNNPSRFYSDTHWKDGIRKYYSSSDGSIYFSPFSDSSSYFHTGAIIRNYQISDIIGKGGLGEVYRAKNIHIQREVAIKVYRIRDETVLKSFLRGANLLSQLNHTNIITMYDFFVEQNYALMVMEILDSNATLREWVGGFNTREGVSKFVHIFSDLLSAMRYCHQKRFQDINREFQRGIYHGDIKPDNIFLNKDQIKIADFMIPDLERFLSEQKARFGNERFPYYDTRAYGTPMYMSPEQENGEVNEQTDIYNIGITAFELLTGFYPYDSEDEYERGKSLTLQKLNPYIPDWLSDIILKSISHETKIRYTHISEIQKDLTANINKIGELNDNASQNFYIEKGEIVMGDKKIEVLLGDNAKISGDFVVANSIKDSFNRVTSANISNELKDLLKDISVAVGKMSEELPKEKAEQVARDLETLTAEATSENPRRKWWELSIDGLKEAAKNIGEIGKPVIDLATHIATVLSGLSAS